MINDLLIYFFSMYSYFCGLSFRFLSLSILVSFDQKLKDLFLIFLFPSAQVQLLYELTGIMNKVWNKIQKRGNLSSSSAYPESVVGPFPSSPVRSSIGTAPPDNSTCSPSADIGTTTEVSVSEKLC